MENYYCTTKNYYNKAILLVSRDAELITSISGSRTEDLMAKDSMDLFHLPDLLTPLTLFIEPADPSRPECNLCQIYDISDGEKRYLKSDPRTLRVTGTARDKLEADLFGIYDVGERQIMIYSNDCQALLSVDLSNNVDPDGAMYHIKADKKQPDTSCVFYYAG